MKAKRIITFLLAATLIFSSLTFAASAEDTASNTAEVTLRTLEGTTAVKSFDVGDTFMVYTYMNTVSVDDGKLSSVRGEQYFNEDVLSISAEYITEDEPVSDDTVFPVMGESAYGNTDGNAFYFVGSKSSSFIFDNDDCKLVVTEYTVKAPGQAEIYTEMYTLAKSDKALTKIIDKGVVQDGYSVGIYSLFSDMDAHSHALTTVNEEAPTQTADGHSAYKYCAECGGIFDDSGDRLDLNSTVIEHQYVVGNQITLKDEIGIYFYLYVPDYFGSDLDVTFTWGNRTAEGTLRTTSSYGANYRTICYVSARCMTDSVHMSLTSGENEILSYDYRVVDYAQTAAELFSDRTDLKDLLCSMLNYGGAVQRYAKYKTDDPADNYISLVNSEWTAPVAPASLDDNDTDINTSSLDDYGVKFEGTILKTTSKAEIELFFTVTDSELFNNTSVQIGGKNYCFTDYNGGRYKLITITGISAKNIFDPYTLTFTNGSNTLDTVYSAKNYYNRILNDDTYSEQAIDALKAMYIYSESAKAVLS